VTLDSSGGARGGKAGPGAARDGATPIAQAAPPLRGVIPILVTPFASDGSVDLDELEAELEFLLAAGVVWVGFGYGSEAHRLSPSELGTAMRHAVRCCEGRARVVGNAEMTSVSAGIEAVGRVRECGADLAMMRLSSLGGAADDELLEALAAVALGAGLPIVVQDAPQNTGVQLSADLLARLLCEVPAVAAVKIEPPAPASKMSAISELLERSGRSKGTGTIVGGSGGLDWLHELERGAEGTMPGPAHPELFAAVAALHERDERALAFELFARVLPLITLAGRSMESFLFVQKHVLVRRGVLSSSRLRRPHSPLEAHLAREVDEILEVLGLFELFERCRQLTTT
jgi:4-hydroxy-tetrahydrodipicolinate synthase